MIIRAEEIPETGGGETAPEIEETGTTPEEGEGAPRDPSER